jgi:hypothetical protein
MFWPTIGPSGCSTIRQGLASVQPQMRQTPRWGFCFNFLLKSTVMVRLLDFSPYILASATIALAVFELIKDWKDYKQSWLKRSALVAICVVAALTFVSLYQDGQDKRTQREDAKKLEGQVEAANTAQTNNTALFLKSFKDLSQKVGDLQSQVTTDALQKKLASVQAELQNTQKALVQPKATPVATFQTDDTRQIPITEMTVARVGVAVSVPFVIYNPSDTAALNGGISVDICKMCTYASEPAGFTKVEGAPEYQRSLPFQHIFAKSAIQLLTLHLNVPFSLSRFGVGVRVNCDNCSPPEYQTLWVTLK